MGLVSSLRSTERHTWLSTKRRCTCCDLRVAWLCLSRSAWAPSRGLQGRSQVECSQLRTRAAYSWAGRTNLSLFSPLGGVRPGAGSVAPKHDWRSEDPALKLPSEHLKTAPMLAPSGLLWFLQPFLTWERTMISHHLSHLLLVSRIILKSLWLPWQYLQYHHYVFFCPLKL